MHHRLATLTQTREHHLPKERRARVPFRYEGQTSRPRVDGFLVAALNEKLGSRRDRRGGWGDPNDAR